MNRNTKITKIYTAVLAVFTIAAVTLRTVACLTSLDYAYGYFSSYTLISASGTIAAIGSLFFLSYVLLADKLSALPSFSGPSTYMPTGLVATALIFLAVSMLTGKLGQLSLAPRGLVIPLVILALLSVLHFFLNAFVTEAHTEMRAYFSLATVVFLGLYATYLYFDTTLTVNAPNKLTDQLAYLFSALFFLYEARISLGRERWRAYCAFGFIAALFTAYSSIPSLIVYFIKGRTISNSIEENILTLSLFIFLSARIVMVIHLKEKTESAEIMAMQAFAERREEFIAESINVHKEAFAVQMTIDDLLPKPEEESTVSEEIILPEHNPDITEEAPEQITLEMLLPEIEEKEAEADN